MARVWIDPMTRSVSVSERSDDAIILRLGDDIAVHLTSVEASHLAESLTARIAATVEAERQLYRDESRIRDDAIVRESI